MTISNLCRTISTFALSTVMGLLVPQFAIAATLTWDGDVNNDYYTADNWDPDGVTPDPFGADDVIVNTGTPVATVNAQADGAGSVTIGGGDLTWSGRFHGIGNVNPGATGLITSGSLTVNYADALSHSFNIGNNTSAIFQQQGGTVTAANSNDEIFLGNQGGGDGTYEISGGTLNAGRVHNGVAGTGTVHIIGDAATINLTGSAGTSYSQNASSTLELDINGISVIDAATNVSLAGTLDVEFTATPNNGEMFTIIDYDGTLSGTFGTFDNVVDSPLGADTITLSIDYGSGTNDVVKLTVESGGLDPVSTPEPSALILATLSLVGLCVRRRRNR